MNRQNVDFKYFQTKPHRSQFTHHLQVRVNWSKQATFCPLSINLHPEATLSKSRIRTSSLLTPTPHNSTYHFDSSFCTCGEIILRSQANHVVELPCTSSLCFSGGS
ncbi:hypothetical protein ABKN59_003156 [Abortiporus biennis]